MILSNDFLNFATLSPNKKKLKICESMKNHEGVTRKFYFFDNLNNLSSLILLEMLIFLL